MSKKEQPMLPGMTFINKTDIESGEVETICILKVLLEGIPNKDPERTHFIKKIFDDYDNQTKETDFPEIINRI